MVDTAENERLNVTTPEKWEAWVPRFMEQRYAGSAQTFIRYNAAWHNIAAFFRARRIDVPRQLDRIAVRDFIAWRGTEHDSTYRGCKNTALNELRFLGLIMREAVQCGFASVNPCERLGIRRDPPAVKPRITEAEHRQILAALDSRPKWMRVAYMIAWEQGCRFSETSLHIPTQVDIDRSIIRFRTKGHKLSLAEFPLSPKLVPMFARMIAEGRVWSYEMPISPTEIWWRFFRQVGLPHLCFHCLRVTFITRCYEAGISQEMVMRLVGHASATVHAIYPRLTANSGDLRSVRELI